jgi:hypothetical protein
VLKKGWTRWEAEGKQWMRKPVESLDLVTK